MIDIIAIIVSWHECDKRQNVKDEKVNKRRIEANEWKQLDL